MKKASLTSNLKWLLIEKLVRVVLGLLITAAVARHLGPEQFGRLALCIAAITLCQLFSQAGMERILVLEFASDRSGVASYLRTAIALRFVGWVVGIFVLLSYQLTLGPIANIEEFLLRVAFPATAAMMMFAEVYEYALNATSRSIGAVRARVAALLSLAAIRIFLIAIDSGYMGFAAAALVEPLIFLLVVRKTFRAAITSEPLPPNFQLAKNIIRRSWPIFISTTFVYLYTRADQLILASLVGAEAAGLYAAVIPLSNQNIYIFSAAVCTAFLPVLMGGEPNEQVAALRLNIYVILLSVGVLVVCLEVAAGQIVHLLLGKAYSTAVTTYRVHLLTAIFAGVNAVQTNWFAGHDRAKLILFKTAASATIGVGLLVTLVPKWGIVGAAVAAVGAEASAFVIGLVFGGQELRHATVGALHTKPSQMLAFFKRRYEPET